ncbi:MAG: hypothetical protein WCO00_11465 [Rhodospirillaceae bacterium]
MTRTVTPSTVTVLVPTGSGLPAAAAAALPKMLHMMMVQVPTAPTTPVMARVNGAIVAELEPVTVAAGVCPS